MKIWAALTFAGGLSIWPAASLAAAPSPAPSEAPASDPEMKHIFDEDQADRSGDPTKINWRVVGPRDAARREATRRLLAEGRLRSGQDFLEAAFVFQHSSDARDYLLAHALAIIAAEKGTPRGAWIAAATLDRYLQTIGRSQIFGTQFKPSGPGAWTQEPYDHDLISDALRRELGVPDAAGQASQLQELTERSKGLANQPAPPETRINCTSGPLERVYLRDRWKIYACDNGGLMALGAGARPDIIMVLVSAQQVSVLETRGGGDEAETRAATAALQAMTPADVADIAAQAKAVKP